MTFKLKLASIHVFLCFTKDIVNVDLLAKETKTTWKDWEHTQTQHTHTQHTQASKQTNKQTNKQKLKHKHKHKHKQRNISMCWEFHIPVCLQPNRVV